MKKYIALLLAIVLCLTVLVGCASQQTPDVSEPEDTTPEQTTTQTETPAVDETAETQDVELWYYWETESHQITLQAAIDALQCIADRLQGDCQVCPVRRLQEAAFHRRCCRGSAGHGHS